MRRASLAVLEDREGRAFAAAEERRAWADEAERTMRATGDMWQLHEVVFLQCRTKLHDGDLAPVHALTAEAVTVAGQCESAPIFAEALMLGAEVAARSGDDDAALRLVDLAGSVTATIWNRRWLSTHRPDHVIRLLGVMDETEPRMDIESAEREALAILARL
jgi:hypothetical protein